MFLRGSQYRFGLFIPLLLVAGFALAACGGDDDDSGTTETATIPVATATAGGSASPDDNGDDDEGEEVEVVMTDNVFTPSTITVKAGQPVTFVAKNEGAAIHNMHVLSAKTEGKDFASDALVNPGKESKFTVTFTQKGKLDFQCDYHLPAMAGTIEVQ